MCDCVRYRPAGLGGGGPGLTGGGPGGRAVLGEERDGENASLVRLAARGEGEREAPELERELKLCDRERDVYGEGVIDADRSRRRIGLRLRERLVLRDRSRVLRGGVRLTLRDEEDRESERDGERVREMDRE